jgi:hypothetical protein
MHGLNTIIKINGTKPKLCNSCKWAEVHVGMDPCNLCYVSGKSATYFVPRFTRIEKAKLLVGWAVHNILNDSRDTRG